MARIARVEAWPVNVALEAPYAMAPGTYPGMSRTVVRVTTEDGIRGLGEGGSSSDADAIRAAAPGLAGRDAGDVLAALGAPRSAAGTRTDATVPAGEPLAAVEMALCDAAAREAGVPLWRWLGGTAAAPMPVTEYFAYRAGREDTPAELAAYCARMAEAHDAPAFEGKVGVRSLADDLAIAREVRAAIGPDRTLRLDANMGWWPASARAALAALEPLGIDGMEEPVAGLEAMAALRRRTAIPLSAHSGELAHAAALGAPDALVLSAQACGGVQATLRFAAACAAARIAFWFYSGDLGIATAAHAHLTAASPHITGPSQSLLRWSTDDVIAGGPLRPHGGSVAVPEGPGLGVELDPAGLCRGIERYAREGAYDYYTGPGLPRY